MKNITISTQLKGKEEMFKLIALSEATNENVLMWGSPGVAKSNTVKDYIKAYYPNPIQARGKLFSMMFTDSTKESAVRGMIDIDSLVDRTPGQKVKKIRPICDAEFIYLDELEKAPHSTRNYLLDILESPSILMDGTEVIFCKKKVAIATINEIPKEDEKSPLFDRFIIKYKVNRADLDQLIDFSLAPASSTLSLNIPDKTDLDNISVTKKNVEAFFQLAHTHLTDRTLTKMVKLVKAISVVWDLDEEESWIKCAELVCPTIVQALAQKIENPIKTKLRSQLDALRNSKSDKVIETAISEIKSIQLTLSKGKDMKAQMKIEADLIKGIKNTSEYVKAYYEREHEQIQELELELDISNL